MVHCSLGERREDIKFRDVCVCEREDGCGWTGENKVFGIITGLVLRSRVDAVSSVGAPVVYMRGVRGSSSVWNSCV